MRYFLQKNIIFIELTFEVTEKQSRIFKSVVKLDRNFDICIHGNKKLNEKP
ncbi:hypothetical protein CJ739_622 [Mariniflexile rhizosphaerae]|nr:hypothetical protein CJ739_622 [Mariniflexile sp. TRM1-10]